MTTQPVDPTAGLDLPTAGERRGDPGHDQAMERANAVRLLTLRAARMTYAQIAEELGYADASGARNALLRALDRHEAENVAQLRTLENLSMDTDERALRVIIGDPATPVRERVAAIRARTQLGARRSRLNGLDAPIQVALSAGVEAELADALAEVGAVVFGTVTHVDGDPV